MQATVTISFTGDHQRWDHSDYWGRRAKFGHTYNKRRQESFDCVVKWYRNAFGLERGLGGLPTFQERWRMQYNGFYDQLKFEYDDLGLWTNVRIETTDPRVNALGHKLPSNIAKRIHQFLIPWDFVDVFGPTFAVRFV